MKYTINKEKEDFKPIQIILTIESRDELIELYKRLNINGPTVDRINDSFGNHKSGRRFSDLWNELNNMLE